MDVKVGMINWDAGLTEDTFFGHWAMNSLGREKWKSRLPYYAVKATAGAFPSARSGTMTASCNLPSTRA